MIVFLNINPLFCAFSAQKEPDYTDPLRPLYAIAGRGKSGYMTDSPGQAQRRPQGRRMRNSHIRGGAKRNTLSHNCTCCKLVQLP